MNANALFQAALQLDFPWEVTGSEFEGEPRQLVLVLDFKRGAKFPDPETGELCPVHDTVERSWKHLCFWQYQTILRARVPRIVTPEGKIRSVEVPWARPGSGFTLMFEAFAMLLCREMPVSAAADILNEHDTRLWRMIEHYVTKAHSSSDWSQIRRIAVDETSVRKGHRYVTNAIDLDTGSLLFMYPGRTAESLAQFKAELIAHGGSPENIEVISMDMSPAYRKGAQEHFPNARIVFDKFHVMQLAGNAVDQVRKELQRGGFNLKGAMWTIRGNEWNLSDEKKEERRDLRKQYSRLGRAMNLRDSLQDMYATPMSRDQALEALNWWCRWALLSRLDGFRSLAKTLRAHLHGVLSYFETPVSNGLIEAINGVIQLAKRAARGFRTFSNFQAIAYWRAGKLTLDLPSLSPT